MRIEQYTLTEQDAETPVDRFEITLPDTAFLRGINLLDVHLIDTAGFLFTPYVMFTWRTRNISNSGGQREIAIPLASNAAGTVLSQDYRCEQSLNLYTCKEEKTKDNMKKLVFQLIDVQTDTPLPFERFVLRLELEYDLPSYYPEVNMTDAFVSRTLNV